MSAHQKDTPNSRYAFVALLRRLHFYIGLFIGPFIFVAALTGTLYVLSPQLENIFYEDVLFTDSQGIATPLSKQITTARHYIGEDATIYAVRPAPSSRETTRVQFVDSQLGESQSRSVFIDPYTLAIRGDFTVYGTSGSLPLVMRLSQLHRSLLLGDLGRNYSELAASLMWVTAISGLILWAITRPKKQKRKARTAFAKSRRYHIVLGLVLFIGMVFFSATGLT